MSDALVDARIVDPDNPPYNFTGYFIPVEIVQLFWKKEITVKEMMLWSMVRSLTDYQSDPIKPCYASKKYFAHHLALSERHVKRIISKLKDMGLLEQAGFDGRVRKLLALNPPTRKTRNTRKRGRQCPPSELRGDASVPSRGSPVSPNSKGDSKGGVSKETPLAGFSDDTKYDREIATFTKNYAGALQRKFKNNPTRLKRMRPSTWPRHIKSLYTRHPPDEVRAVLKWYLDNIDWRYMPRAAGGRALVGIYDRIKEKMEERSPPALEISKDVRDITKTCLGRFPSGTDKEEVLTAAQMAWNVYRDVYKAAVTLKKTLPEGRERDCVGEFIRDNRPGNRTEAFLNRCGDMRCDGYVFLIHRRVPTVQEALDSAVGTSTTWRAWTRVKKKLVEGGS